MSVLSDRICARRKELDITQEGLSEMMGYRSRSSINKIEKGENDIPQSKISAFAIALKTTPAYLLGWTDDPTPIKKAPDESGEMDPNVKEIVDLYNAASPEMQATALEWLRAAAKVLEGQDTLSKEK